MEVGPVRSSAKPDPPSAALEVPDPSTPVEAGEPLWTEWTSEGLRRGATPVATPAAWSLEAFAGRFGEISGGAACATLTLVFRLVYEAQRRGEVAAWIGHRASTFYPPDVAATGVDLDGLVVVRIANAVEAATASDLLVRSGSFAIVVVDFVGFKEAARRGGTTSVLDASARRAIPLPSLPSFPSSSRSVARGRAPRTFRGGVDLPIHAQTRLAGLAKRHDTAFVCLTDKDADRPSIGSLVSLRAHAARTARSADRYRCEIRVLKDKRRGPGRVHVEECHVPDGLC